MKTFYTTIKQLRQIMTNERHLVNTVIDRSGALITDSDVVSILDTRIETQSRIFDGYLRGFVEVPILPTASVLTGAITMVNGQRTLTGAGTLFTTELAVGNEIRLDAETDCRVHIASIFDNTHATLEYSYYGTINAGDFSKYVSNIPPEVDIILAGRVAYFLWQYCGRKFEVNPHKAENDQFLVLADRIRNGDYRFDTSTGEEISPKPTQYDTLADITTAAMSDDNLAGYIP
jgi:hypothetical protein